MHNFYPSVQNRSFHVPLIATPEHGQRVRAVNETLIRIDSSQTGGHLAVMDITVNPGEGTLLLTSVREDKVFRVLAGNFTFDAGDDRAALPEGSVVVIPRCVPHRYVNTGNKAGLLTLTVTPGGFERFLIRLGDSASLADTQRIADSFGISGF